MFTEILKHRWTEENSLLCVGLDPEIKNFPENIRAMKHPIFEFNKRIIDATADLVCAFKPQIAHYAAQNAEDQLKMTIDYIHDVHPGVPVILDSKRGDIGSTAQMYALEAFERYRADAVTVNPYLGHDSLLPFLKYVDKGVILLCRTSNPGAKDLQDLPVGEGKLFHKVAELAAKKWNANQNILLVVGATYPTELKEVRSIVDEMPLLLPGVGAQGADVSAAVKSGKDSCGGGLIISSTRAIIYSSSGPDFADAARKAAEALKTEINKAR